MVLLTYATVKLIGWFGLPMLLILFIIWYMRKKIPVVNETINWIQNPTGPFHYYFPTTIEEIMNTFYSENG